MPRKKGSKNRIVKSESCANPFVIASNLIEHNTRIFHLEKACSELGTHVVELVKKVEIYKTKINEHAQKVSDTVQKQNDRLNALEKSVFEIDPDATPSVNEEVAESN